ncbi:MAG: type I DNA topoisomerase, partial [Patescibacteria group bacterium]
MNLIIVESPTKAKTISKFLDNNYQVESSYGHIRDLPKSKMGIDTENDFQPTYVIPTKARKTVNKLKNLSEKASRVILAADEDREGEAIAWHLIKAMELPDEKIKRIAFHEITESAIKKAMENPRNIDMGLVNAQQARRILDRLVGYELSPFLWKKVAKGLSAGRVQSVAVRFIVEREREIQAFVPEEYWSITAKLEKKEKEENNLLEAKLNKIQGKTVKKLGIKSEEEKNEIMNGLKGAKYAVANVLKKETSKKPPAPFTTSTLQQTANRWLGFSSKQTMTLAQRLYEGVNIKGEGQVGLITYMRTDSMNLSQNFLGQASQYLKQNLGDKYAPSSPRVFKTKSKNAQEAHEAVRPTDVFRDPESLRSSLDTGQYKLYKLIWQRSLATQMPPAKMDSTTLDVDAVGTPYQFRATGQVLKFDGYLNIYPEQSKELQLPEVAKGEELNLRELLGEQHFTKPPARYSDAGLVKEMESYGIGRPSTYAPIISTVIARNYVNRDDNKKLAPTDIAFVVNDLLVKHFSDIVDYEFTAQMENDLDEVADGNKDWQPVVKQFYNPFHQNLLNKYEELNKQDIMPEEKSQEKCDKCGAEMIVKTGRYGKFLACSGFPDCKNIKPLDKNGEKQQDDEKTAKLKEKYKNEVCDKCGSPMDIKNGKYGPFLACTGYPKCKNIKSIEENNPSTGVTCPKCGKGEIIERKSKRGVFYACNQYPDCKNSYSGKPTGDKCPDCESLMIEDKNGKVRCSN